MEEAIASAVTDGDSVYLAGFTHLIPFAAGHEIIRQGYTDLDLVRATPDLIYDQMIAGGCAAKVTFSWAGNPGVGGLRSFRRAAEEGIPNHIALEEYTHFGMVSRLHAGATNLPFMPLRSVAGSDLGDNNDSIRTLTSPYGDDTVYVVPPLNPDVAVIRAQRADPDGNAQVWGIVGEQKEAAFAADTVILSVEEVCDSDVIRSDPNRTVVTESFVEYVVEEPYGSHPSYAQGFYDRDNQSYLEWNEISRTHESITSWLDEWVYGVANRREYMEKLGSERILELRPKTAYGEPVNYGGYS